MWGRDIRQCQKRVTIWRKFHSSLSNLLCTLFQVSAVEEVDCNPFKGTENRRS